MSLLSDFLGTEDFSLMDSPMFQELVENIKNNRIYSANNDFDYALDLLKSPKSYRDEIHFTSQLDEQNISYNLNTAKANDVSRRIFENKESNSSRYLFDSENLITIKNSEVAA